MPDSPVVYLIDTCVLVNIRDVHGDSDEIWAKIVEGIQAGSFKTVRHVMDELQTRFPDIFARLKPHKKAFIVPNTVLYSADTVAEIAEIRVHHPELYDASGEGNPADPFLIGCGKAMQAIVVTDERTSGKKHKQKIPFVCKERNVGCMNRFSFFEAVGIDYDKPGSEKEPGV